MNNTVTSTNEVIENAIIEALKEVFPEFDVESFPSDFEHYNFTSPTGCLLVKYLQTDYSDQNTLWNVSQNSAIRFNIISGYRGLKEYKQTHKPQQMLKDALQGLEILGRKIQVVKEQFLTEINTDLYCGLTIKIEFVLDADDLNDEIPF